MNEKFIVKFWEKKKKVSRSVFRSVSRDPGGEWCHVGAPLVEGWRRWSQLIPGDPPQVEWCNPTPTQERPAGGRWMAALCSGSCRRRPEAAWWGTRWSSCGLLLKETIPKWGIRTSPTLERCFNSSSDWWNSMSSKNVGRELVRVVIKYLNPWPQNIRKPLQWWVSTNNSVAMYLSLNF